jgi:dienelactone hydrolase
VVVLLLALLATASQRWLVPHARTILLLSQELPQSPVRPLHLLTHQPRHEQLRLESSAGPIVADLFAPTRWFGPAEPGPRPAIVVAMGVKLSDHDRRVLLRFADTLARLGFVVLFPRLVALDQGVSRPEEPTTFIAAVRHLQATAEVDRTRISLLGISIGASTALIAASDPALADDVHAVIFFGGFYNVLDYVLSLATGTMVVDDRPLAWEPDPDAVGHMRQILEAKEATWTLGVFDAGGRDEAERRLGAAPDWELAELRRFSPAARTRDTHARVFVLHDRGDRFVPYTESIKLHCALPPERVEAFLLSSVFEHAQFKRGSSVEVVADLAALYGFVTRAFGYLDR